MDRKDRDTLIERYKREVDKVVEVFLRRLRVPPDYREELVAAGYLGLVEAAGRYDWDSGIEFGAFLRLRMRGAIIDALRRMSGLSGQAHRLAKALQTVQALREQDAADGMLRKDLAISDQMAVLLEHAAHGAVAFKISLTEASDEVDQRTASEETPETICFSNRRSAAIERMVSSLPEKEQFVIRQLYFCDRSLSEIAEQHGTISKSWISRLHVKAIDRLRRYLREHPGALA